MSTPAGKSAPVVLIVEDEPLLRMLAVEVVEDAGFVALEARDADEAVILLESRNDISVLFTDINMPGSMDGLKLAHAGARCGFSPPSFRRTLSLSENHTRPRHWSRNCVRWSIRRN